MSTSDDLFREQLENVEKYFEAPDSFWRWTDNVFRWFRKNVLVGGIAIFISLFLQLLVSPNAPSASGYFDHINILSFLVLGMTALMVNTDFHGPQTMFFVPQIFYIKFAAAVLIFAGFLLTVLLTPSPTINILNLKISTVIKLSYLVGFYSICIALIGHVFQVLSDDRARKFLSPSYNDEIRARSNEISEKSASDDPYDGMKI
jgi:hypothetical protein